MDLPLAQKYAAHILKWLAPHCTRIEIAGSIRRQRPHCADVDLVCIPKHTIYHDMFQVEQGRQNHLWMFLKSYVENHQRTQAFHSYSESFNGGATTIPCSDVSIKVGSEYVASMKQMIVQLPKCQLDLWFATEQTFPSILLMRTGSKEHNIWFAERAQRHGLQWKPYEGLFDSQTLKPSNSETDLYAHLGLKFIEPQNREIDWLRHHIDSGLTEAL